MQPITRRTVLFATAGASLAVAPLAHAVDALPDARFVGFVQDLNQFEIDSGRLALERSSNENVRGFASRAIADYTEAAETLRRSRSEAGVSYAPDGAMGPKTANLLAQLKQLQGPAFDTAYANAQLSVQTDAEAQIGAYSQNGSSGPLKRYAQNFLPKSKAHLEYARRLAGGR